MPQTFKDSNLKSTLSLVNLRVEWIHMQRTERGGNMHINKVTYNTKEHNKEHLMNMTTKEHNELYKNIKKSSGYSLSMYTVLP